MFRSNLTSTLLLKELARWKISFLKDPNVENLVHSEWEVRFRSKVQIQSILDATGKGLESWGKLWPLTNRWQWQRSQVGTERVLYKKEKEKRSEKRRLALQLGQDDPMIPSWFPISIWPSSYRWAPSNSPATCLSFCSCHQQLIWSTHQSIQRQHQIRTHGLLLLNLNTTSASNFHFWLTLFIFARSKDAWNGWMTDGRSSCESKRTSRRFLLSHGQYRLVLKEKEQISSSETISTFATNTQIDEQQQSRSSHWVHKI